MTGHGIHHPRGRTGRTGRPARRLTGLLVAALPLAGLGLVGTASAAHAENFVAAPVIRTAYTDSARPDTAFLNRQSLPLGARRVGAVVHRSRVYLSYDISAVAGTQIRSAVLSVSESTAGNCADRQVQLWRTTAAPTAPTWNRPRKPLELLGTFGATTVCPAFLQFDITPAVTDAAAHGHRRLSLMLRNAPSIEGRVALGRVLSPTTGLAIRYNSVPSTPSRLFTSQHPCTAGDHASDAFGLPLGAIVADADPSTRLTAEFEVTPDTDPAAAQTFTATALTFDPAGRYVQTLVPAGALTDGQGYSWRVRVSDEVSTSGWSAPCAFVVDSTRPGVPAVSSPQFPADSFSAGGTPGIFTFDNGPGNDVAFYQYAFGDLGSIGLFEFGPQGEPVPLPLPTTGIVRPSTPGGPAVLSLVPPSSGPVTLQVRAFDAAGNASDIVRYSFFVRDTSPTFTGAPDRPDLNVPFTVHLTPNPAVGAVQKYTWTTNEGVSGEVPADPDGTGDVTLTFDHYGVFTVELRSVSANGWISSPARTFQVVDNAPGISSPQYPDQVPSGGVGLPGTITFTARQPGAVSVVYSIDGSPDTTLPLGPDGTASVEWTPTSSGFHGVFANTVDDQGVSSDFAIYNLTVN